MPECPTCRHPLPEPSGIGPEGVILEAVRAGAVTVPAIATVIVGGPFTPAELEHVRRRVRALVRRGRLVLVDTEPRGRPGAGGLPAARYRLP
jgi:hypothetical protein